MDSYNVAGLRVESEVTLPGLIPAAAHDGSRADVAIALGAVPEQLAGAEKSGPTWQATNTQFLLTIPNIGRFLLAGGRRITAQPLGGTPPAEIAIFLLGTVFGILLHQRAQIVLHASAVRVGGKAVLFCGASGAGKSTLAAALVAQGYPLVSDDLSALTLDDNAAPQVQPDGRQLKLWSQAIRKLDLGAAKGAPVRSRIEKFYVEPGCNHAASLPLGAIYMLREARPPHEAGIARPDAANAALLLRQNAYRPRLVEQFDQTPQYFQAAADLAGRDCIFHLTRRMGFAGMDAVTAALERHWREIGLMEQAA